jgi:hypothetical protein
MLASRSFLIKLVFSLVFSNFFYLLNESYGQKQYFAKKCDEVFKKYDQNQGFCDELNIELLNNNKLIINTLQINIY